MKKINRRMLLLIMALLMLFSLTGCGNLLGWVGSGSSAEGAYYEADGYTAEDMAGSTPMLGRSASYTAASMNTQSAQAESDSTAGDYTGEGRKLIRTVDISMESKEIGETAQEISRKVTELGGYIEQSSINSRYGKSVYMTARIPADRLDEFILIAESAGNVLSKNEQVTDITLQYSDTESHIASLKVERERLDELMQKAEDIETILAIEDKLTDIRYELDSYESTKRRYDNQVDYATVTIDISEVEVYTPPVKKAMNERIAARFEQSLKDVRDGAENFVVWLIGDSPVILLWLLAIAAAVLIIKGAWILLKKLFVKRDTEKAGKAGKKDNMNCNNKLHIDN